MAFRIFNLEFEIDQGLEDLNLIYLQAWKEAKRADAMEAKKGLMLGETLVH